MIRTLPIPPPEPATLTVGSTHDLRLHGWTTVASLTCPRGHHIRQDAVILEHGAVRCKHKSQGRPHERGIECGAWLYVLGSIGWTVVQDESGHERVQLGEQVYVAAVTYDELRRIRARRLTPWETLRFLGIAPAAPDAVRATNK